MTTNNNLFAFCLQLHTNARLLELKGGGTHLDRE